MSEEREIRKPIVVQLCKMGQPVESYTLEEGDTVERLLRIARTELYEGETLQKDGVAIDQGFRLSDGDRIFIIPPASGGN